VIATPRRLHCRFLSCPERSRQQATASKRPPPRNSHPAYKFEFGIAIRQGETADCRGGLGGPASPWLANRVGTVPHATPSHPIPRTTRPKPWLAGRLGRCRGPASDSGGRLPGRGLRGRGEGSGPSLSGVAGRLLRDGARPAPRLAPSRCALACNSLSGPSQPRIGQTGPPRCSRQSGS
jgi:hypothetical protein